MGFEVQNFTTNADSGNTSAASSVANNDDSTYLNLYKNSTKSQDNTQDLSAIIEKAKNYHEVVTRKLASINTPKGTFHPGL